MRVLGLVGYGTVAGLALTAVAAHLERPLDRLVCRARPGAEDRARAVVDGFAGRLADEVRVVTAIDDLLAADPDLVVEAAGHAAVAETGAPVLAAGGTFLISSVGALSDADLHDRLLEAARRGGGRLALLPGAIGGLDLLGAARLSGLAEVTYVSRKPPRAWAGTPAASRLDLDAVAAPTAFYEGNAREAARDFPKNANVAATVALAGLGFEATRVRLIADPTVGGNVHEIVFRSACADATIRIEGRPSPDNPKTSATTGWSLARAILDHFA